MAGCMRYCVSSSVYHESWLAWLARLASSAAASSRRRMHDLSCPCLRAASDAIVAGSCAGSPTSRHRLGFRASATTSSHSSACAASSTISASKLSARDRIAWPLDESVAKTTSERSTACSANTSAREPLPEPSRSIAHVSMRRALNRLCVSGETVLDSSVSVVVVASVASASHLFVVASAPFSFARKPSAARNAGARRSSSSSVARITASTERASLERVSRDA